MNTTSNVTSANGGTGNTGTDTLTVNLTAPLVAALKSSSFVAATNDLDGSGSLSPGDTLVYTILVTNTGAADALAVMLTDTPGAYTSLVAGSVTTTQGTVTSGNQAGATSVTVDVGTLAATTGQATVSFTVRLDNPFPTGVTTVMNQATVSGSNFPNVVSDNPATTPSDDPTVDVVSVAAVIPTLSEWGAMILVLLLAAVAVWRLRNGQRTVRNS
ncbi:MAG TPA: IPTL-CTERM sorting domain-containing protein [Thermoanaerobaculia bacterium]|nr:IPTL-CTERM sorting domain-containing protein [Thermoanaerobaculia bacterium]